MNLKPDGAWPWFTPQVNCLVLKSFLGGVAYIGRPKQPTVTVCRLVGEDYEQTQFRLTEPIVSLVCPLLNLTLQDLMPKGS